MGSWLFVWQLATRFPRAANQLAPCLAPPLYNSPWQCLAHVGASPRSHAAEGKSIFIANISFDAISHPLLS